MSVSVCVSVVCVLENCEAGDVCSSASGEGEPLSGDYCVGSAAVRRSFTNPGP